MFFLTDVEIVPSLPSKQSSEILERSPSPWHDVPTNNRLVSYYEHQPLEELHIDDDDDDKPPPLPKKTRRSTNGSTSSDKSTPIFNNDNYINRDFTVDENNLIPTTVFVYSNNNNNNVRDTEISIRDFENDDANTDPFNNFKPFPQPELVAVDAVMIYFNFFVLTLSF